MNELTAEKTRLIDENGLRVDGRRPDELRPITLKVGVLDQADGSAYSSVYMDMNQLYNSRIIVQGEADAIVTIGISHEPGKENVRYINVPKNKLAGGKKSDEAYRHDKFECNIIPDISRYID